MPTPSPETPHTSASHSRRPTRIIAMLNQKGGVGKTTTTVNLGAAMAMAGRKVCLIDLDPQAHLSLHLGIDPDEVQHTVYDVLTDPACTAAEAICSSRENLDCLPAEVDLAAAESELASNQNRHLILRDKFRPVANRYEFVLIDCPPSLGLLTLNAMGLAREVFVPMQAHFLAMQGVGKLLETVGLVARGVNSALKVTGVILCCHDKQTTHGREVVADLDEFFGSSRDRNLPWSSCRLLKPAVRRNIKLAEAPSFGQTVFEYDNACPGAADYRELAHRVTTEWDHFLTRRSNHSTAKPPDQTEKQTSGVIVTSRVAETMRSSQNEPVGDREK